MGSFRDGEPVPYEEDGRLGGFAAKRCGDGRFYCDNPSVSFADSSLYTREPWGAAAPVR